MRQQVEGLQRFFISDAEVARTAGIGQESMLRADARIVKPADTEWVSMIWPSSSHST